MERYYYKAKDMSGKTIEGLYESSSERVLISMLNEKGFFPTEIKKSKTRNSLKETRLFNKITTKDLSMFCRQFSVLLSSGIPLVTCLDILRKQESNPKMLIALNCIFEEVQKGKYLSQAMKMAKDVFPKMLISMVEAGETSGTLDETFKRMEMYYGREFKMKKKIQNAMVYPVLVLIVAIIVVIFLLVTVVPMFVSIFEGFGQELPGPTKAILAISNFLKRYWVLIVLGISALASIIHYRKKRPQSKARFDGLKLKLPVYGPTLQKIITYRFAMALGGLLKSGIPLIQSLDMVENIVDNEVYKDRFQQSKSHIQQGLKLSEPLDSFNIFPPMVIQMIRVGEESGTLDEMLLKIASFYENETEVALTRLTTLIEPVVIIILAVVVGFIVLSIALPMFNMYNFIS
ncbi:MAG: type II secretion system F family protein [Clostridia bacterium]|nr:type II secretion system F family protein [Clostridia bacterium]